MTYLYKLKGTLKANRTSPEGSVQAEDIYVISKDASTAVSETERFATGVVMVGVEGLGEDWR